MMESLTTPARARLQPLHERWRAFWGKVQARVAEVEAEAEAGLDELVRLNPLDTGPIGGGLAAVEARFRGLREKVEQAVSKLEQEWDEATDGLDLVGAERRQVTLAWRALQRERDGALREVELRCQRLLVRKQADWARLLQPQAERECAQPRVCPQCGASFQPKLVHGTSNVVCAYCGAVNEAFVGSATALYYGGAGVDHLARERSFEPWVAMTEAERAFKRRRWPTEEDWQESLAQARAYWTAFYQALVALHPGFNRTVAEAAEAKLAQPIAYDRGTDRAARALRSEIVRLARAGETRALQTALARDPKADLADLAGAVLEHGDRAGAVTLLELRHARERRGEPKAAWVGEQLEDLEDHLAAR
ncbi:MAG: hypothetical protein IPG96_01375 [Proteobacteria bacterium]|nr:hypothetical protein [Pseudomonadota bacterium]